MSDASPSSLHLDDGVTYTDNVFTHMCDVGACYGSLWNWHKIHADHVRAYYEKYPAAIDLAARRLGYRVRPSWVWTYEERGAPGLIVGIVNDGVASVPGILRVSVLDPSGSVLSQGALDAGYPLPGKVRQVELRLPPGTVWKGLRLKAQIEVKGQSHGVRWACKQSLNADGTLTLRPTTGLGESDETGGLAS